MRRDVISRFTWLRTRCRWPLLATCLVVVFAFLLPVSWFRSGHFIFHGDPIYPFDPVHYFHDNLSLWVQNVNLGAEKILTIASLPYTFLQAVPAFLGAHDNVAEILHFMVWFALPGVTIALFTWQLCRIYRINYWAVPVSTAGYLFNLYRLAQFIDNNHILVYALTPLALYCLTLAFEPERKDWLRPALGIGLSTFLLSRAGTNPPMYLMFWFPIVFYGLGLAIIQWRNWKRYLGIIGVVGLVTLLVNLFWLVPFTQTTLRQTSLASAGNLDWLSDLSKHTSLQNVLRLIGAWDWFGSWESELYTPYAARYQVGFWYWLSWFPLALSGGVLLFVKKWRWPIIYLVIIGIIGLTLSQGMHPPSDIIFSWLAKNVPFFWVFRSPWYKFTNMSALSFAVLGGLTVGLLFEWLRGKSVTWLGGGLIIVAIVTPMLLSHPLITGERWIKQSDVTLLFPDSIPYPDHIRQAADWLNDQPGNGAVGLLPYYGSEMYRWGYASIVDPLFYMSDRPVFVRGDRIGYVPGLNPGASVMYRIFYENIQTRNPDAERIAQLLGMEYLIVRNDFWFDFYPGSGVAESPAHYKELLESQPNLSLVRSFGEWDVYRFSTVQENKLYGTTWGLHVEGHPIDSYTSITDEQVIGNKFPAVLYTSPINQPNEVAAREAEAAVKHQLPAPTLKIATVGKNHYAVSGNSNEPFILVLNQSHDQLWQAYSKTAEVGPQLIANGYAPAWLITPKGEFIVQVHFMPQRTVPIALGVSLVSVAVGLFCLLWPYSWRRELASWLARKPNPMLK